MPNTCGTIGSGSRTVSEFLFQLKTQSYFLHLSIQPYYGLESSCVSKLKIMIPIEHKFEFIREKGKMTGFHIGIYSPQILTQKILLTS